MDKRIAVDGIQYIAEISYSFEGKYRPATRIDPEETPDCIWEVEHVRYAETGRSVSEKEFHAVEKALEEIAEEVSMDCEDAAAGYAEHCEERDQYEDSFR